MRTGIIVLLSFAPSMAQINLEYVAKQAEAVVVGRVSDAALQPAGADFKLAVLRSVHGNVPAGSILNITAKFPSTQGADLSHGNCSLVFLARGSSGWEALGSGMSPSLSRFMVPLVGCGEAPPVAAEGASVFDKCFAEIALSATRTHGPEAVPDLFNLAGTSDSPLVTGIMHQLSTSTEPRLRAQGLAWEVRRGDAGALVELAGLALSTPEGDVLGTLSVAVRYYANTDATGVAALGRLVSDAGLSDQDLKHGAAHALRNIHSREAVPFLAGMLDSPDPRMTMEAVSGLTEHVIGVRAVSDGPEKLKAVDEVFNPAHRKDPYIGVDPQFLHMGFFKDKEEEARVIDYWRQWWQANRVQFATP